MSPTAFRSHRRPARAGTTVVAVLAVAAGLLASIPTPAEAGGSVVVGPVQAFTTAYPSLAREDFEGSRLAPGTVIDCGAAALSSASESPCYDAGALTRGATYSSDPAGALNMAAASAGWLGATSTLVASNNSATSLVIDFTVPVDTFGFAVGMPTAGACTVVVSYVDGSPSTTLPASCPAVDDLAFIGVRADRLVDKVRITGAGNEALDDLRFGLRAPSSVRLGRVRTDRRAGTAVLSAVVPGIGTTTLGGRGVVPVARDSAGARTHALPVAVRGKARRTLQRTGRVTVLVRVTYRPNGGTPTTASKRITLRKRR
ncbi:hypothetical protein [Nocardioides lijunqiniae]|uniref:hypothetical protein n=1 Tax=Nocardioides lijunqiniae TaxID=2760832 RepID=UPI001878BFE2|nr:hypothetical protein [Nocardioides lijunqiniae]